VEGGYPPGKPRGRGCAGQGGSPRRSRRRTCTGFLNENGVRVIIRELRDATQDAEWSGTCWRRPAPKRYQFSRSSCCGRLIGRYKARSCAGGSRSDRAHGGAPVFERGEALYRQGEPRFGNRAPARSGGDSPPTICAPASSSADILISQHELGTGRVRFLVTLYDTQPRRCAPSAPGPGFSWRSADAATVEGHAARALRGGGQQAGKGMAGRCRGDPQNMEGTRRPGERTAGELEERRRRRTALVASTDSRNGR